MRICKIWDADYPWDVRVEKVARALTDHGHEVHIVARNRRGGPVREALPEGTVHRLRRLPLLSAKLNDASMFPAFFNPRWIRTITGTARDVCAQVLLCRDLPLAPSAVWAGRRMGIPVVLDMAENYPAMIRAIWETHCQRRWDWLVRNPRAVAAIERWAIREVDHILVVVEESRDRLISMGVDPRRITVVSNTPWRNRAMVPSVDRSRSKGPLRLVYLGLLEAPRGISTVIESLHRLRDRVAVRLDLIGTGREREAFESRVAELGLQDRIHFHGYVPNQEALRLVEQADVGLIPHHANDSWNTTIPNKLFDYMAAGLPVLTSDAKPVARIVREVGCGQVFRDRDSGDLASAIERLVSAEVRDRYGRAGREAVQTRYNWERDTESLLEALDHVTQKTECCPSSQLLSV